MVKGSKDGYRTWWCEWCGQPFMPMVLEAAEDFIRRENEHRERMKDLDLRASAKATGE